MKSLEPSIIKDIQNHYTRYVRGYVRLYRFIWRLLPKNFSSFISKSVGNYAYVSICRKEDFDMVLASLYTLYRNANCIPSKIYVVSDGSWDPEVGLTYFSRYQLPVECLMWETCADFYSETCPALFEWARKHIWGKKMATILYLAEQHAVAFSDPDVLWYRSPLTGLQTENTILKISIDNSCSYDQNCIKALHLHYLNERDFPINCGVLYMKGGLAQLNEDALRIIAYQAEHCGPFAEQTVFAALEAQYNCRWTEEEVRSDLMGAPQFLNARTQCTEQLIARHYLWCLKPIYWRDLFHMYFQ